MKPVIIIALVLAVVAAGLTKEVRRIRNGDKRMVCYYGAWAIYRPGRGRFAVEDIDPTICTHLMYGFAKLEDNVIKSYDPWEDLYDNFGKGGYKRFAGLKKKNPDLKVLIAIGGWNEGSEKYSKMASNPTTRRKFVKSIIPFLEAYGFDGLDLDWEYPTTRGGNPEDKENFSDLVSELRRELDRKGYLLTAAVSPNTETVDQAYEVATISQDLDFVSVMCYDYHGAWEGHPFTGHNTPLYKGPKDEKYQPHFNVNNTITHWINAGLPKEKINLGMALYGRGFNLDSEENHGLYAPAKDPLEQGPYTRQPGTWGYNEICEVFKSEGAKWKRVIDPYIQAPYAYSGRKWIGYDDVDSLYLKAKFAREMDLGGAMVWSVETDDFKGFCHNKKYILINTIRDTMEGGDKPVAPSAPELVDAESEDDSENEIHPPTTTRRTKPKRTTTPSADEEDYVEATTKAPKPKPKPTQPQPQEPPPRPTLSPSGECREEGIMAGSDCSTYVVCQSLGNGRFMKHELKCAAGLAFDPTINSCNYPANVEGCSDIMVARFYRTMIS